MNHLKYSLKNTDSKDIYAKVLERSGRFIKFASLTVYRDVRFSPGAIRVFDDLACRPDSVVKTVSSWPGTVLHSGVARLVIFDFSASLPLLRQASDAMNWLSPELPEDLALYRLDMSLWMGSVSHENWTWFESTELEMLSVFDKNDFEEMVEI